MIYTQIQLPVFLSNGEFPELQFPIFKKGSNVTSSIFERYNEIAGEAVLEISIELNDGDTIFGPGEVYDAQLDRTILGPALVLSSDIQLLLFGYTITWQTVNGFYYLYNFNPISNDTDNYGDGIEYYNVELMLDERDVNISLTILEGYDASQITYMSFEAQPCFIYENGSVVYTQKYTVDLYDEFSTTDVMAYIEFEDLIPSTPITPPGPTGPTEPREYTLFEWTIIGVVAMFVIVSFILMINQAGKRKNR
jgi:hypothetical protein